MWWFFLGIALASDSSEPLGPAPNHEVMRPVGLHAGGVASVPGPSADCQAKAQVYMPYGLCKNLGVPSDKTARPVRMKAVLSADPPLSGASCALVCTPGAKLANWSFILPQPGYRGQVQCTLSARVKTTLDVSDESSTPTAGATIQWQTDLNLTDYRVEDPELLDGHPKDLPRMVFEARRWLDGAGACPAGQPSRPR
ncbi:MAG: hypothetical protein AB8H79_17485 [Myxococcota bacterium]